MSAFEVSVESSMLPSSPHTYQKGFHVQPESVYQSSPISVQHSPRLPSTSQGGEIHFHNLSSSPSQPQQHQQQQQQHPHQQHQQQHQQHQQHQQQHLSAPPSPFVGRDNGRSDSGTFHSPSMHSNHHFGSVATSRPGTPTKMYYTNRGTVDSSSGQHQHHSMAAVASTSRPHSGRNSVEPYPPQHQYNETPEPRSPIPGYPSTLKVVQWTPQNGGDGCQVTIVLDPSAIKNAPEGAFTSDDRFTPSSSSSSASSSAIKRQFSVMFGNYMAQTSYTRANVIDGNGVGTSMVSGTDEEDAFVVLTTFAPPRKNMGPLNERAMVVVQVLDVKHSHILEECIVGEWAAQNNHPRTPPRAGSFKRTGEDLMNSRNAPGLLSPVTPYESPNLAKAHHGEWLSPQVSQQLVSPNRTPPSSHGKLDREEQYTRHAPLKVQIGQDGQPELVRTSQIPNSIVSPTQGFGSPQQPSFSNKAILKLHGDLNTLAMGWSNEEWTNRRRLIQFWRQQEGNVINATFRPIPQSDFVQHSIVISCIFRDDWNECFVTSVDTIYLLEALVGLRFTVEEKNRIRRNLEGFKPITVSKSRQDPDQFFKLIMGFPNPKPRNIEKDVKVFPWKVLGNALKKIISKYSATYTARTSDNAPPFHISSTDDSDNTKLGSSVGDRDFAPVSPHLISPSIGHSPHLVPSSSHIHSPGLHASSPLMASHERYTSAHTSPNPGQFPMISHSHDGSAESSRMMTPSPTSPTLPTLAPAHTYGTTSPSHQGMTSHAPHGPPLMSHHHRPGSFDFHHILDPFAAGQDAGGPNASQGGERGDLHANHYGSNSQIGRPQHPYNSVGYPHLASSTLFPTAEDYGAVGSDRLVPPPLNHSRSYSEQPRRSLSGGGLYSSSSSAYGGGPPDYYQEAWTPTAGGVGGGNGGGENGSGSVGGVRRDSGGWKYGASPYHQFSNGVGDSSSTLRRPTSTDDMLPHNRNTTAAAAAASDLSPVYHNGYNGQDHGHHPQGEGM